MRAIHEEIIRRLWDAEHYGWKQIDGPRVRNAGNLRKAAITLINEGIVQTTVGVITSKGIVNTDSKGATYYRINPAVREVCQLFQSQPETPAAAAAAAGVEEIVFKACVQIMINAGIHPSGTAINDALGRDLGVQRNLSGREGRWREEVFRENGWVYDPESRPRWRAA